jgi:hypothetical protein
MLRFAGVSTETGWWQSLSEQILEVKQGAPEVVAGASSSNRGLCQNLVVSAQLDLKLVGSFAFRPRSTVLLHAGIANLSRRIDTQLWLRKHCGRGSVRRPRVPAPAPEER